jgi:RNase P subunit RPR2
MSPDAIRLRWKAKKAAQRSIQATACEKCGATSPLHRHHPRYDQPLRVVVLCRACHVAVHVARGDWGRRRAA